MKKPTEHIALEKLNAAALARVDKDDRATSSAEEAIEAHRKAAIEGEKERKQNIANRRAARKAQITSPEGDNA